MNRPSRDFPVEELYWDQASSQPKAEQTVMGQRPRAYEILSAFSMSYRSCLMTNNIGMGGIDVDLPEFRSFRSQRLIGKQAAHTEPASCKRRRLHQVSQSPKLQLVAAKSRADAFHNLVAQMCGPRGDASSSSKVFQPRGGVGGKRAEDSAHKTNVSSKGL